MHLNKLLDEFLSNKLTRDVAIKDLKIDSRKVSFGDLFFAVNGATIKGKFFIPEAIKNGAVAVVLETSRKNHGKILYHGNIPIINIYNLKNLVSFIAAKFYNNPSRKMQVIGVTGTNGKTSCSHILARALENLHKPTCIIGTLGNGTLDNLSLYGSQTTPDPIYIQKLLAESYAKNITHAVVETSSHALMQARVAAVAYSGAILTNLASDHLDYHKTISNYASAKYQLFTMPNLKFAIFNLDDAYGVRWAEEFKNTMVVCGFSLKQIDINFCAKFIYADNISFTHDGISANIISSWGDSKLDTKLLGQFNLANILAVICVLCLSGFAFNDVLFAIKNIQPIEARMQAIKVEDKPLVVVDFAHTEDALKQALQAVRLHTNSGKLFVVFGCGGSRDRTKRSLMGKVAENFADKIILTDDNLRQEKSADIINDILIGINDKNKVTVINNRVDAIKNAINIAGKDDVILVAGKGHEKYQIVGNEYLPYVGDAAIIKNILQED